MHLRFQDPKYQKDHCRPHSGPGNRCQIQKCRRQDFQSRVEKRSEEIPNGLDNIPHYLACKESGSTERFLTLVGVKLKDPTLVGVVGGVTSFLRFNDCNFFSTGVSF